MTGVKAVATPDLCDRILIARLSLDPEALAHSYVNLRL